MMTYSQCLEKYGSNHQIQKAIDAGLLFKLEKGVYSDSQRVSELAIIGHKYPEAVITMNSAFYYHSLTDVIPDEYYIATKKNAQKLRDARVKQIFVPEDIFCYGITTMQRRDATFKIYDKERMLVELLRFKNLLPYDYYKEILGNYRDTVFDLDISQIEEYAAKFPKSNMIMTALKKEVF